MAIGVPSPNSTNQPHCIAVEETVTIFGIPGALLSDRGINVLSNLMLNCYQLVGTKKINTSLPSTIRYTCSLGQVQAYLALYRSSIWLFYRSSIGHHTSHDAGERQTVKVKATVPDRFQRGKITSKGSGLATRDNMLHCGCDFQTSSSKRPREPWLFLALQWLFVPPFR